MRCTVHLTGQYESKNLHYKGIQAILTQQGMYLIITAEVFWASKINEYQTLSDNSMLFYESELAKVNTIREVNRK